MKHYQREKAKLGNAPGTIINWSSPVVDPDPNTVKNKKDLPAGYLKCDGSVYSKDLYPRLAEILGTGAGSIYKKQNTTLSDNQFQLPDLGSKHIQASASGNVGLTNDATKISGTGANSTTVKKAGVGVDITSNVGENATVSFNGVFTVPQQNFALNGNIGWTIPTVTETESVGPGDFGPHMHRTSIFYVAVKDHPAHPTQSRPSYLRAQDASWTGSITQTACNGRAFEYYTTKNSIGGEGNCAWRCTDWNKYFMGYATSGSRTSGSVTATATALPSLWNPTLTVNDYTATSWPNLVSIPMGEAWAYDTRTGDEGASFTYPAASNAVMSSESPPGSETTDYTAHSHRVSREYGDTAYNATTNVATMRPDGLQADVNLRTSNVIKFDDVVSPYIVLEYLIKF